MGQAATRGLTRRVLLAEDNPDHLFLVVRALRDFDGMQLEIASVADGEEALDYLYGRGEYDDRELPHLIVLDLKMPRVNGLEVLQRLKTDEVLRSIPVVVLTSSERTEDVDAVYQLGGNSYMAKRIEHHAMRERLGALSRYWLHETVLPEPPA